MKNNRILCIGDSTSLPGHTNTYDDTWFYKLKQDFHTFDFISVFRRSITTNILVTEGGGDDVDNVPMGADCLEFYNPSIVVLQLGIVDCAPRLLNRFDKLILMFLPNNAKSFFIKFLKSIKKRRSSNTLVSLEKFQSNFKSYIERCLLNKIEIIILISIPYPDERMISKNVNIIINVEVYNKILSDLSKNYSFVKVISPLDSRNHDEIIFEDGYHPNPLGNQIVFQNIKNIIKSFVNQ